MAGLVIVDSGPELDARGTLRIRLDLERAAAPDGGAAGIGSVAEYERMLSIDYPAARPDALARMARYGLRPGRTGASSARRIRPSTRARAA